MSRLACLISCLLALLAFPLESAGASTRGIQIVKDAKGEQVCLYKESHALVIAVADYEAGWSRLPGVLQETQAIELALEKKGFQVKRVVNPDEAKLKSEFEAFIDTYGYDENNRLLVFFSGHGYSRKGHSKGYLVPVDAPDPRRDEKGFLRKALPMSQVLAWCRQMEAKHVLLLFDSCFSGTIFKTKALPKVPPHISSITSRPVRQIITAGDAGEEVPAKSVFARCFLRALQGEADLSKDGYVTGSELGMYLHDKVLSYRTGQTPQYGKIRDVDLDEGDFVFLTSSPIMRAAQETPVAKTDRDLQAAKVRTSSERNDSSCEFDSQAVANLSTPDQEIVGGLRFSDFDPAPLKYRHGTYPDGEVTIQNSGPRNAIIDKLTVEVFMLMRDRDQKWNAVRATSELNILQKGSTRQNFQYQLESKVFEKLGGSRDARIYDHYAVIRYDGLIIYSDHPGKDNSNMPTEWWTDPDLLYTRSSLGDTTEPPNASAEIEEALAYYSIFLDPHSSPAQAIPEDQIGRAYLYAKILASGDRELEALDVYDSLLESKLEKHTKRQFQAETGSLLVAIAKSSQHEDVSAYLDRAKRIADELLWIQDLYFGNAIAILAQVHVLEGNTDKALKLFDSYKTPLTQIDDALRSQSTPDDDLTKLSPMAHTRYAVAVVMQEEAARLIGEGGSRTEILELLAGKQKGSSRTSGALQHFLNVSLRYPESKWAEQAGERAGIVKEILETRFGAKVKIPLP